MGVYFRPERGTWWLKIPTGKDDPPYLYRETVFSQQEEARAQAVYDQVLLELQRGRRWDHLLTPDLTLRAYGRGWCEARKGKIAGARDEDTHLELHVYPTEIAPGAKLGDMLVVDVRPKHVEAMVEVLKKKLRAPRRGPEARGEKPVTDTLSAKYIKHIIGTLHRLYSAAVFDELVTANPVVVRREVLPKKKDRGIRRSTAVFAREEVELLISHELIPQDRRVSYALLFLTGMRPQEFVVRRWRDRDRQADPLPRISVMTAWSRNLTVEKETKTDEPREIPEHPTLTKVLSAWELTGFARYFGQAPGLDDYLVPSRTGKRRSLNQLWEQLQEDCERIGIRRRRAYDARRTFISLARAAGAHKEDLRWITHGVREDVVDDYTTPPWPFLCGLVSPIKIKLREGRVHQLGRAAGADLPRTEPRAPLGSVTKRVTSEASAMRNPLKSESWKVGPAGLEPALARQKDAVSPDGASGARGVARGSASGALGDSRSSGAELVTAGNPPEISPGCEECRQLHAEFEALMLDGDLAVAGRTLRELVEHCAKMHGYDRAQV